MSRKLIGSILLLILCEVIGVFLGIWFFRLFVRTVPPMALSSFNQGAAQVMFVVRGMVSGLALFLISLLAVVLAPLFRSRPAAAGPHSSVR